MSVRLTYYANFKWHFSIWGEICHSEQTYMPFFGTITERAFREKSKIQEHIQMIQRCALDFFPQNALGDGPASWIFFQDSRIRVKGPNSWVSTMGWKEIKTVFFDLSLALESFFILGGGAKWWLISSSAKMNRAYFLQRLYHFRRFISPLGFNHDHHYERALKKRIF